MCPPPRTRCDLLTEHIAALGISASGIVAMALPVWRTMPPALQCVDSPLCHGRTISLPCGRTLRHILLPWMLWHCDWPMPFLSPRLKRGCLLHQCE